MGARQYPGWIGALRAVIPIVLVAAAVATLWVEAPAHAGEPAELDMASPPPPQQSAPKIRELTYEPWELVKT